MLNVTIRVITIQADPTGSTCQGGSITYDVTLPTGETQQHSLDVTPWIKSHQAALDRLIAEADATLTTRYA